MPIQLTKTQMIDEAKGRLAEAVWLIQRATAGIAGAAADPLAITELLDDATAHVADAQGMIELAFGTIRRREG